jgi:hypothetical protein
LEPRSGVSGDGLVLGGLDSPFSAPAIRELDAYARAVCWHALTRWSGVGDLNGHGPMKHDPGLLHTLNAHLFVSQRQNGQEHAAVEELEAVPFLFDKADRFILEVGGDRDFAAARQQ